MSFLPTNNPCPCESGLDYLFCCGNIENKTLVLSTIDSLGQIQSNVPEDIKLALRNFPSSPDLFPININSYENKATLIKMSPFWFSESIFVDKSRILGKCALEVNLQWLKEQTDGITYQKTPFIFHTAFCGSTILSRALDNIFKSLQIREPDVLGSLYQFSFTGSMKKELEHQWYARVVKLLSRRFEGDSPAIVKANDFTNPILPTLLSIYDKLPVLLMYIPFSQFFASCIKSDSRQQWISDRYNFVKPNLNNVFSDDEVCNIEKKDIYSKVAIYWAYNIKIFLNIIELFPDRVKSLDFNDFLAEPKNILSQCKSFFGLEYHADVNIDYELNYLFSVYSKDPDHPYNPDIRKNEIKKILSENDKLLEKSLEILNSLLHTINSEAKLPNNLATGPNS